MCEAQDWCGFAREAARRTDDAGHLFWNSNTTTWESARAIWIRRFRELSEPLGLYTEGEAKHRLRDSACSFWSLVADESGRRLYSLDDVAAMLGDNPVTVFHHYHDWFAAEEDARLAKLPAREF